MESELFSNRMASEGHVHFKVFPIATHIASCNINIHLEQSHGATRIEQQIETVRKRRKFDFIIRQNDSLQEEANKVLKAVL